MFTRNVMIGAATAAGMFFAPVVSQAQTTCGNQVSPTLPSSITCIQRDLKQVSATFNLLTVLVQGGATPRDVRPVRQALRTYTTNLRNDIAAALFAISNIA